MASEVDGTILRTVRPAALTQTNEWAFELRSMTFPLVGGLLLAVAVAVDAGTRHEQPVPMVAMSVVHIIGAGVWFGVGLTTLLVLARRVALRQQLHAARLVAEASTLIMTAIAATLVSGAAAAALIDQLTVGSSSVAATAKIFIGLVAFGLAVLNRKVLSPRLRFAGESGSPRVRALLTAEVALLTSGVVIGAWAVV